jgi:hypothetical protein
MKKVKIEKWYRFWILEDANWELYVSEKREYFPLVERKPEGIKDKEWVMLDKKALGVIGLALARNVVAFSIAKQKITTNLMAALSNMYEKPFASKKVIYLM